MRRWSQTWPGLWGLAWFHWRSGGASGLRVVGRRIPPGAAARSLAILIVAAAAISLSPAPGKFTAVLMSPGSSDADALAMIAAVDGQLVWTDPNGDLLVVALKAPVDRWRLYGRGALIVGGAGPAGCLAWAQA